MLDFLTGVQSQLNNILLFRNIFSMRKTLKRAFSLPLDYYSQSGKATLFPLTINLLITLRCNAHCEMCCFQEVTNTSPDELKVHEIKEFVQDVARHKPSIFLGGGEPFMRKDIFEIIRVIKGYGLVCGIITNGLLLDENKIQQLIALNVEYIVFSLHGPEEVHDNITGVQGAYKKLLENIKIFCKYKTATKVIINCAIMESNYQFLEDIVKIGKSADVDAVRFEHLVFLTDLELEEHHNFCKEHFGNDKEMSVSTYIHDLKNNVSGDGLCKIIEKIKKRYGKFVIWKPLLSNYEIRTWYAEWFKARRKCFFVWGTLFISPNGDVIPCQFYPDYKLGNIRDAKLKEIWNNEKYRKFRLELKKGLFPGCARCCKL